MLFIIFLLSNKHLDQRKLQLHQLFQLIDLWKRKANKAVARLHLILEKNIKTFCSINKSIYKIVPFKIF